MREQEDSLAVLEGALTGQELKFVQSLTSDPEFSLSNAARSAGFLVKPDKAAERLLKNQAVVRYLAAIQQDQRIRLRDIRDGVLQTLWQLAAGWDIAELVGQVEETDADGVPQTVTRALSPDKLPAGLRAAVKEVKRDRFGGWEYKFVDRSTILGLLLKHFGEADKARLGANDAPVPGKTTVVYPE